MTTATTTAAYLSRLKSILQGIEAKAFEDVVAALISDLLDVGIAVAKSGFQHGGDAGPAGRQDRRFRIETKRYADTTSFSDRELLGEIDHALKRDAALEAWILGATRDVPEQLEQDFLSKSDQLGLPIVVIDWKTNGFPTLAALCTCAPKVLDALVSSEAGDLARGLAADGASTLAGLKRDMEAWNLGYERLLLWLSGDEELEAEAVSMDPDLDRGPDLRAEYLADPGRSFFALERRHADLVARDIALPLGRRIDKISTFQVDPNLELPEAL